MKTSQGTLELIADMKTVCGESPIWDPETGLLVWTDTASPFVHVWDPAARRMVSRRTRHTVRAVARAGSGRYLLVCEDGIRLLPAEGEEGEFLCHPEKGQPGRMPNDGTVDPAGRFLFDTFNTVRLEDPSGSLYSLDASGKVNRLDTGLVLPNGIAFSPDGLTLYVAEMFARRILRYEYDPVSGRASGRRVFAEVPDADGLPDGLVVDSSGFVWSAHWAGWRITRYAPDGSIDRVVPLPFATATCMGFGGPGLRDLYITSATMGLSPEDLDRSRNPGGLFAMKDAGEGLEERVFGKTP